MPAPDRTTVKATAKALMTQLRSALRADPPTSSKPFRRIEEGAAGFGDYPRPFLTVSLVETRPLGTTEGDKIVGVTLAMRLVTDVVSDDPHEAILDAVAAVDDFFDDLLLTEDTVVVGAEGFDDRVWGFGYPKGAAGVQAAEASCRQSFVVKVARGAN